MLQAPSPTNATRQPGELALVLADREQVGEQLAGVELVGERVDDRHAGVRGHLLDRGLGVGPPDDHRGLPAEHPGDVGDRLALADAGERAVDHHRVAAELGDAGGEGRPGCAGWACRRSWRRCAARRAACASYGACLSVGGQVQHLGLLGRAEVVVARGSGGSCAWLLSASTASSRIPGQAARNASTSSSPMTSGGARRTRSGVGLLTMKPWASAAAATSAERATRQVEADQQARGRGPRCTRGVGGQPGPEPLARRRWRARAGRPSRWCRGRRARRRRRPGCRRTSCRGCRAAAGWPRRRGRCRRRSGCRRRGPWRG